MTQAELASAAGSASGKEVHVQHVDDAAFADIMKGALAVESNDFEKLLGRPTTPIDTALKQIISGISQDN